MKLSITNEWTVLPIERGTVDNPTAFELELAAADENDGIRIYPKTRFSFKGAIKVRCTAEETADSPITISVVSFSNTASGSGAAGDDDETATDGDIDNAFDDVINGGTTGEVEGDDDTATGDDIDDIWNDINKG